MFLPIIIIAYNRPRSLERLFKSLLNANYENAVVDLTISIDQFDNAEVYTLCKSFHWPYGNKTIISQESHLGLKDHVLFCGDLAAKQNGAIILEDDLVVSKYFYQYSTKASETYFDDPNIAGISLYNYQYTESRFVPFKPLDLGFDTYFMQIASSWGQIWNARQWIDFKDWLDRNPTIVAKENIPSHILEWGENSWKKHFNRYLIARKKYFVYPTSSHSTNFEDPGTHASTKGLFQVDLSQGSRQFAFDQLYASNNRYDGWYELEPLCLAALNKDLADLEFTTDLYGSKTLDLIDTDLVLTSRDSIEPIKTWSSEMHPLAQNIVHGIDGTGICLTSKNNIQTRTNTPKSLFDRTFTLHPNRDQYKTNIVVLHLNNSIEALKKTINSAVNQSSLAWVLIIVTNNPEIGKFLSDFDCEITIITSSQTQALSILSEVLPHLSGNFTFVLQSGDVMEIDAIELGSRILDKHGEVEWLAGSTLSSKDFFPISKRSLKQKNPVEDLVRVVRLSSSIFRTDWLRSERVQAIMKDKSVAEFCFTLAERHQLPHRIAHPLVQSSTNSGWFFDGVAVYTLKDRLIYFIIKGVSQLTKSTIPHIIYNGYFNRPHTFRFDQAHGTWYRERF